MFYIFLTINKATIMINLIQFY